MFVAQYNADFGSSDYTIVQAAANLYASLDAPVADNVQSVMGRDTVIFVAHSLGGILTRRMLVDRREHFARKSVALLLVSSPSLGSRYADFAAGVSDAVRNKLALILTSQDSDLLDLNDQFRALQAASPFALIGRELCEQYILPQARALRAQPVVGRASCSQFFPEPLTVEQTDHMSIAKPTNANAVQQRELMRLIRRLRPPPAVGLWQMNFQFVSNSGMPEERSRPWVRFTAAIDQQGARVSGTMTSDSGGPTGTFSCDLQNRRCVNGRMRLNWDLQDWQIFEFDFSPSSFRSASGRAEITFPNDERHGYTFTMSKR